MANLTFTDLYLGDCENCGASLEDWEWFEDDMKFRTNCTCGSEYTIEPTVGVLDCEVTIEDDEDDC